MVADDCTFWASPLILTLCCLKRDKVGINVMIPFTSLTLVPTNTTSGSNTSNARSFIWNKIAKRWHHRFVISSDFFFARGFIRVDALVLQFLFSRRSRISNCKVFLFQFCHDCLEWLKTIFDDTGERPYCWLLRGVEYIVLGGVAGVGVRWLLLGDASRLSGDANASKVLHLLDELCTPATRWESRASYLRKLLIFSI